ncbi:helix-turn-helix domain-containing protein [Paenibacillus sp. GCM10027626]|uniref:helix-turn-helix domain-containing protein n=1 Tax=Paenibacillus sp. GCM10027626 TaxID=3273411 RepID=UPI0036319756
MATKSKRFPRTKLSDYITVRQIVSLHYFEFSKDFIFDGEKHNFWEFVYVDRGEVEVIADEEIFLLKQGDIIFHKPNEYHNVWANKRIAPNVIIISFVCRSPGMRNFENKLFSLNDSQQQLMAQLLKNGFAAFHPPFDDPRNHTLKKREDAPPAAEQQVRIYLELLLIHLLEDMDSSMPRHRLSGAAKEQSDRDLIRQISAYMEQHVFQSLKVERICQAFSISRSHAFAIFKERTGQSIMHHFRSLKIERAKQMIREERHNITEIAELLQYSSVHSFSRQFKMIVGMSPTEYARSVKSRI